MDQVAGSRPLGTDAYFWSAMWRRTFSNRGSLMVNVPQTCSGSSTGLGKVSGAQKDGGRFFG